MKLAGKAGNNTEQIARGLVYDRVRKAYARKRAKSTGGRVFFEGELEITACPFSDLFNGLLSPCWPEEKAESLWRRALMWFASTGQDMYLSLGPASHPVSLKTLADRDGFRCCSLVPFMHLELANLRECSALGGLRIERIDKFSFFERHEHPWLGPVNTPYRRLKLEFLRGFGEGESPCLWQFVALYNRRLVGAATMFAEGEEGAVFDVVVEKTFRHRGIGTRLMAEVCRFSREKGLRTVGLAASGEGVGMYRKLGFEEAGVYCDYFLAASEVARFRTGG